MKQKLSDLEARRREALRGSFGKQQEENDLLSRYTAWVDEQRAQAKARLTQIRTELAYETMCLNEARQESRKHSVNGERRSNVASRQHVAKIEQLQRQLASAAARDPDMFYVQKEETLWQDMQEEHNSRLVNVPYLSLARRQIRNSLEAGIPVYLVGHLGSGKTQLAIECAEDYMRDHLLQKKLHEAMEVFRQAGYAACPEIGAMEAFRQAGYAACPGTGAMEVFRQAGYAACPEIGAMEAFRQMDGTTSHTVYPESEQMPDVQASTKSRKTSDRQPQPLTSTQKRNAELFYFQKIYPKILAEVQEADCHPYFIAGSHNLTAEDMFFEKTLRLSHASDSRSNEEELDNLINGYMSFLKENESRMQDMNQDQKLELMLAGWKTFSNLYVAQNSGYGTTVEKIEKEVLLALREGRPLVIDEINTIAMANLIGLNDILQHHAGQTAYITGVGSVKIADGFCLIGTGNLSTGTVSYEGTNVLNPAFQSRFTTVVYNYVPQSIDGDMDKQEHPEHNELFRLIVDHLCEVSGSKQGAEGHTQESSLAEPSAPMRADGIGKNVEGKPSVKDGISAAEKLSVKDGISAAEKLSVKDGINAARKPSVKDGISAAEKLSVKDEVTAAAKDVAETSSVSLFLPDPAATLPQLFRLAQLARVSQNIFEGRSSTVNANGDTPVLNEAVLSIRNLIHVLDHWNFGEEEELSMALWNGFLSSVTNADDRNLLLALAVRYGFFSEQEGWHIEARGRGDAALTLDDIRTAPYQHTIRPLQRLSEEDIVYILYGNGPHRRAADLPRPLQDEILVDEDAARNIPTAAQLDASLRNLEHGALVLERTAQTEQ